MWAESAQRRVFRAIPARAICFSPRKLFCCNRLGNLVPSRQSGETLTLSSPDGAKLSSHGYRGCGLALSPTQEKVRFGLFELDLKAAQLTRNGTNIRLPQQPLRLLSVLVESPGDIVTREQLRKRLWPSDIFIDFDHGLNKSIQKLRDALGDSADSPRYIETIPRVGYRFIAPVSNGIRPAGARADSQIPQSPPSEAPRLRRQPRIASQHVDGSCPRRRLLALCGDGGDRRFTISSRVHPAVPKYTQLTDFTDSATTPALSPDGHMLAFIRGSRSFMSAGQIYVKMLPDGEARPLTNDPRMKYNLAFSPDGSQIAYTVIDDTNFATYTISVFGGDPHLLLKNAAGLTWLDPQPLSVFQNPLPVSTWES